MENEKLFEKTPESFSGYSQATDIKLTERRRGLICDDLESLKHALKVYNEEVPIPRETSSKLVRDIEQSSGGIAAALMATSQASTDSDSFVDRLFKEMEAGLKEREFFSVSYDYDAYGTRFFKTDVKATEVDGKYVLELSAAYVGMKPEEDPALAICLYPENNSRFVVKSEEMAFLREARNSLAKYLPH